MIRRLGCAALFLLIGSVTALAQMTGSYYAYGRNPDGSVYNGTVQVSPAGDGSFIINWFVGQAYSGRGYLNGSVLTVDWGSTHPAVYVLMPDGELHGTWADGEGLELWTRQPR